MAGNFNSQLLFMYPGDIEEDDWSESNCSDCHDGLNPQ
jgi:hypothetical protein